eukprot:SAG11_NODE_3832_length_2198_cov_1.252978_1_plen_116_part_00
MGATAPAPTSAKPSSSSQRKAQSQLLAVPIEPIVDAGSAPAVSRRPPPRKQSSLPTMPRLMVAAQSDSRFTINTWFRMEKSCIQWQYYYYTYIYPGIPVRIYVFTDVYFYQCALR